MKKTNVATIDMCNGPIVQNVLVFAIPIIIGNFMQILLSAVDMAVVGKFVGEDALAAVGANISLIYLIFNLFVGLSIGANIVTARYCGAQSEQDVEETVHCSMAICLLSGVFLAILGIAAARFFLELLDTPENIMDAAVTYLRVCALGFPFTLIFNFTRAIVNAEGDTKFPLYCLILAGTANVILNLIFVLIFHLDVFGVALATVFSNGLSAVLMTVRLCRGTTAVKLRIRRIRLVKSKATDIIRIGLPAGLQGIAFSISNVIVQDAVNSFGSIVIAGNTAVINIEGFLYQAMYGFYQASGTFISQNCGARKYGRIKKVLRVCLLWAFAAGFGLSIISIVFREGILGIYSGQEAVVAAGAIRILAVFPLYFLCGLNDVLSGAMRGMGYSTVPLVISLMGACVLRIVWILTVFKAHHTLVILYVSYPVTWGLTFMAHFIAFHICYKNLHKKKVSKNLFFHE
ncbi:MATE family efflux transporter [Anaerovorax odorimutans]|uniref:MATE family efflux transporter n=1 Tax=Anaerovorax odorimutans TaxID=109327 RepID=A0ABT1RRR9_9FIRM|nr:MATE family efflux transporter [Anaerovorax odorimutans]